MGHWQVQGEEQGDAVPAAAQRRLKWKKPLFPPEVWSAYERLKEGEPATTNHLEGRHNRRASASMRNCGIPAVFSFVPLILMTMGGTGPPCHTSESWGLPFDI